MKLKTGDKVRVIAGKDKGKEGKVLKIDRKNELVVVEGVAMVTKHQKTNKQKGQGGIIHFEAPIHASNVMYLHKGKPTRLGVIVRKENKNGVMKTIKTRVAKSTGDEID